MRYQPSPRLCTEVTLRNGARCLYPTNKRATVALIIHLGFGRTSLDVLEDTRLVGVLRDYDLVVVDAPRCGYAFQQGYHIGEYTQDEFWNVTLGDIAETYELACLHVQENYPSVVCVGESTAGAGLVDLSIRGVVPKNVQGLILFSPALSIKGVALTWFQELTVRCLAHLPNRAVGSWMYSQWLPPYAALHPGSGYTPDLYVDQAPISSHTLNALLQNTAYLQSLPQSNVDDISARNHLPVVVFVSTHDVSSCTPTQLAADRAPVSGRRIIDTNINVVETVTLATKLFSHLTVIRAPMTHCFQFSQMSVLQRLAKEIGRLCDQGRHDA